MASWPIDRSITLGRRSRSPVPAAPRPAPADDPARSPLVPSARLVRGPRPDDRPEVDLGRATAEALDPDRHARAAGQRVGGAPVDRHGGQDHVAPRPAVGQRLETEGDGLRFGLQADRVEPQERIAAGARHEVGHPDLVAAVRAGHDRERPRLAGRGVAAGPLGGMRSAPVQDLVLEMRDRGERAGAPAEDALVDLEAAPDEPASSSARTGRRPCSGRAARRPGRRARRRGRRAVARRHPARRRTGGRRRRGWPARGPPGRPRSTSRAGSSAVLPARPVRGRTAGRGRPPDRTAAARGRTRTAGSKRPATRASVAFRLRSMSTLRAQRAGAPHPGARRPAGATMY